VPAIGVNSKSHVLPVHPRVKEIVGTWGGGGGITDEGQDSGDGGGSHSTEKGSTGPEEKAGRWVSQGGEAAEHKEGENLVTTWFIEKNNSPVQPADKWGSRCFL